MQPAERYFAVPSFWAATANPHPDLARLTSDIDTDVAIVGGGFSGLTTAHYRQRSGIDCVVLEANDAGPLSRNAFGPIPLHAMYPLGIRLYTAYYRWLDAREQAR